MYCQAKVDTLNIICAFFQKKMEMSKFLAKSKLYLKHEITTERHHYVICSYDRGHLAYLFIKACECSHPEIVDYNFGKAISSLLHINIE